MELLSGYVCGKGKEKTFSKNLSKFKGDFEVTCLFCLFFGHLILVESLAS